MANLPIRTPFPCGMCGLCPGPPADGPCGARPCVGKFPMWHLACLASSPLKRCRCDSVQSPRHLETSAQTSKTLPGLPPPFIKVLCDIFGSTLVLTPKPSTWKCKFDPEEKFLNSPARIKSRSNPVPQSFISSPAREKSKCSPLPQKFLSSPAREKKETARTGQNTCFQRSECEGDAESFNPNPSAGQEQETRAASKRAGTRESHVRERTLQKEQRRWVTWTSAGAQRIPTEPGGAAARTASQGQKREHTSRNVPQQNNP